MIVFKMSDNGCNYCAIGSTKRTVLQDNNSAEGRYDTEVVAPGLFRYGSMADLHNAEPVITQHDREVVYRSGDAVQLHELELTSGFWFL